MQDTFTNHQYQALTDPVRDIYETQSEYRCMVLPSSIKEGKMLKNGYAV